MNANDLEQYSNTANQSSYTTGSYAPSADALVLAVVLNADVGGAGTPTFSGNGLTWVQVATETYFSGAGRLTLFRAMGSSPSSGAGTATFGTAQSQGCVISVVEFSGVSVAGSDGSGAVVQSATNSGSGTAASVSLSAFGRAIHGAYAVWGGPSDTVTFTPEAGWTEIQDFAGLATQWRNDEDASPSATLSSSGEWVGIGIEILPLLVAAGVCVVDVSSAPSGAVTPGEATVDAGPGVVDLAGQGGTVTPGETTIVAGPGVIDIAGVAGVVTPD